MRKEKQLLLDEVKDQIESFDSFLIVQNNGLTSNAATEFRKEIGKLGGDVEMVKKRLLVKSATSAGIELLLNDLPGHIGLVFGGTDPFKTTKYIFKFSEDNDKVFSVLAGRISGQMYSSEDVKRLSELPSEDEMRANFLGLLEAPMSQTLATLEALLTSVMHCLDNKSEQSKL